MNAMVDITPRERLSLVIKPTEIVAPVRLYPKEHGAYAILGIPLFTALCIETINPVVILIMIAAIAGFMAHEPLMISLGRRGRRVLLAAPQASSRLFLLAGVSFCSGGMAIWWAGNDVRMALAMCIFFAGLGFVLSAVGLHRTLSVQILDMVSLTLPSSAMLLAGGMNSDLVVRLSTAWVIGRIATTTAVRSAITKLRASLHGRVPVMNDILLVGMIAVGALAILLGLGEFVVITPMLATAVCVRFLPSRMVRPRAIGWALLGANILCAIWMICFCLSEG